METTNEFTGQLSLCLLRKPLLLYQILPNLELISTLPNYMFLFRLTNYIDSFSQYQNTISSLRKFLTCLISVKLDAGTALKKFREHMFTKLVYNFRFLDLMGIRVSSIKLVKL